MISLSKRASSHSNCIEEWFKKFPLPKTASELPKVDLSAGDPSVRKLPFNSIELDSIKKKLLDAKTYYHDEAASTAAQEYVANLYSSEGHKFKAEDVFLTQGGEFALTYGMRLLCQPGENCIVPNPGYWHLGLAAPAYGAECRTYGFKGRDWQIDFEELESKIDSKTKFILVVSPGNPNCVWYDQKVLQRFLDIAEKHHLAILSDEIYLGYYFDAKQRHVSISQLKSNVPVVVMGGMAKAACLPGYGMEWLAVKDTANRLPNLKPALRGALAALGTNSAFLINLLPLMMDYQLEQCKARVEFIRQNYELVQNLLKVVQGIEVFESNSSMFVTLRIKKGAFPEDLSSDHDFCKRLFQEENLKLGRGLFNGEVGLMRIGLVLTPEEYKEGIPRLLRFAKKYAKQ